RGTSGIDIDLEKVDINQCPVPYGSNEDNVFAGSARCKEETTKCIVISGLGFRRGSYKCVCKPGYYFPDSSSSQKFFKGTEIEAQYALKRKGLPNKYDISFNCLACAAGCDVCEDNSPCVLRLNWIQRSILLAISGLMMISIAVLMWFSVQYREVKVSFFSEFQFCICKKVMIITGSQGLW
ncbi:hypothetical protein LOTGIDRAFT_127179, partial [Lottia gigantea]